MPCVSHLESALIQHLSLPTFVIDVGHRLLQWNRACEQLTGIPAAQIVGSDRHWSGFYDSMRPTLADLAVDGCDDFGTCYPIADRREDGLHAEGWYRNLNGTDRYLSFYAAPIYGSAGELVGAIETIEDITERKRTEESLRKLTCAVEQSPSVVVITDTDGTIEYVSPKFTALTGYLPGEVIGKHTRMLHSGHLPPEHFQGMWQTISSGTEWRGEFYNRRKNGEFYWESASVSPVKDETGSITHFVALKEEITERKLAGERIRETLSLLHATLESTADGILVRDLTGRCLTYNRKFFQMWGIPDYLLATCSDRQMRLHVMQQLSEPEKFLELTDMLYRCPELETHDTLELKDGRVFERVSKPQVVDREIVGRVISFRDVTERKRAEQALRESAELYRTLVDNIDLGITLLDRDYRIVMVNPAAERLLQRRPGELNQKVCYRELKNRSTVCDHCAGRVAMASREPAVVELEERREDGSLMSVRIRAFPLFSGDAEVSGFIEVIQDITEQVQADRDRTLLETQLRQSQKFEAIGTLAGGIAHDFNNFLTVITSYGTLIQRQLPEGDPCASYLTRIFSATEKAAKLTGGLLAYSRKQPLEMRPVDLNEIIRKLHSLLGRLLGEDVDLTVQLGGAPLTILADTLQMEQVLMNLAANARDAMPKGGMLQISAEPFELDAEFIKRHGFGTPGSHALVTVSDTGEGIDAATRERVFEPFFTTKEVGKGTGLGLSMVYGIIKQHNGYINVYSEPDKGSTFRIYLPLTEGARTEIWAAEAGQCKGGSETILLVEDDAEIRSSMTELLESYGYRIIWAVDGEDGISKFAQHQGEIDLLLLDMIMPKKTGKEVYEAIRELAPEVRVIFMSGYTADILSAKGALRGEVNLITKPVAINQLCAKIREVLDGRLAA